MWLFLAFLAVPLIEIGLFIKIGGAIGLGWTLAIVVFTAFLGTWLVRTQGILALSQVRSSFNQMQDPTEPLAHGAMILLSGVLLLVPGFFTDAVGFALLIPPVRKAIFTFLSSRVTVQSFSAGGGPGSPHQRRSGGDDVIDGEFQDVTPEDDDFKKPRSGLTKD